MTRDDLRPGPPIRPPKLAPEGDGWTPVPGRPYIERNPRGQLRTNLPTPPHPLIDFLLTAPP